MRHAAPHPPVRISAAFEDPGLIERLLVGNGPYWTIQRYVASPAELAAVSREAGEQLRAGAGLFRDTSETLSRYISK